MSDLLKLLADNRGRSPRAQAPAIMADATLDTATVYVYDSIVRNTAMAEMFGGVAADALVPAIRAIPQRQIDVRLNSPGGDVFAARAIEAALREHPARVRVLVDGLAASAASLITMAGDEVSMAPGAMMMLHQTWTMTVGNADEHAAIAELLGKMDVTVADTYAAKCGKPRAELLDIMRKTTWLTAQEAVDMKLADNVTGSADAQAGEEARALWNLSAYVERAPALAAPPPEDKPAPARSGANEHARAQARARLAGLRP